VQVALSTSGALLVVRSLGWPWHRFPPDNGGFAIVEGQHRGGDSLEEYIDLALECRDLSEGVRHIGGSLTRFDGATCWTLAVMVSPSSAPGRHGFASVPSAAALCAAGDARAPSRRVSVLAVSTVGALFVIGSAPSDWVRLAARGARPIWIRSHITRLVP